MQQGGFSLLHSFFGSKTNNAQQQQQQQYFYPLVDPQQIPPYEYCVQRAATSQQQQKMPLPPPTPYIPPAVNNNTSTSLIYGHVYNQQPYVQQQQQGIYGSTVQQQKPMLAQQAPYSYVGHPTASTTAVPQQTYHHAPQQLPYSMNNYAQPWLTPQPMVSPVQQMNYSGVYPAVAPVQQQPQLYVPPIVAPATTVPATVPASLFTPTEVADHNEGPDEQVPEPLEAPSAPPLNLIEQPAEVVPELVAPVIVEKQQPVATTTPLSNTVASSEDTLCVICLDKQRNTLLMSCKHLCLCDACVGLVKECPICRTPITQTIKVFLS